MRKKEKKMIIEHYEDKCECSEDDKCGCSFPNNIHPDFEAETYKETAGTDVILGIDQTK